MSAKFLKQRRKRRRRKSHGPALFSIPQMTCEILGHRVSTQKLDDGSLLVQIVSDETDVTLHLKKITGIVRLLSAIKEFIHLTIEHKKR